MLTKKLLILKFKIQFHSPQVMPVHERHLLCGTYALHYTLLTQAIYKL